jgi:hypothetical protein
MSKHIWLVERFTERTLKQAQVAFALAVEHGLDFEAACRWVGYALESSRQKALVVSVPGQIYPYRPATLCDQWESAVRSKHRYARGRNAANYLLAGRKLLAALAPAYGVSGAPAEVVWDRLLGAE